MLLMVELAWVSLALKALFLCCRSSFSCMFARCSSLILSRPSLSSCFISSVFVSFFSLSSSRIVALRLAVSFSVVSVCCTLFFLASTRSSSVFLALLVAMSLSAWIFFVSVPLLVCFLFLVVLSLFSQVRSSFFWSVRLSMFFSVLRLRFSCSRSCFFVVVSVSSLYCVIMSWFISSMMSCLYQSWRTLTSTVSSRVLHPMHALMVSVVAPSAVSTSSFFPSLSLSSSLSLSGVVVVSSLSLVSFFVFLVVFFLLSNSA